MRKGIFLIFCLVCLLFLNCTKKPNIILGEEYRKFKGDTGIIFSKKLANWNDMGYEYFIENKTLYIKHVFGNYPFEIINNKLLFNTKDSEYYAIFKDEDFKDDYKNKFVGKWRVIGSIGGQTMEYLPNGKCNIYYDASRGLDASVSSNLKYTASSNILRILFEYSWNNEPLSEYYYIIQDDKIILKQSKAYDFTLVKIGD